MTTQKKKKLIYASFGSLKKNLFEEIIKKIKLNRFLSIS